jgi:hypothetical protein
MVVEVKDGIRVLDELEAELIGAKKRLVDLKTEVKTLNTDLEARQRQQSASIIDDKAVTKIGNEIMAIQTRAEGVKGAIKQLEDVIYNLEAQKIIKLRGIARAKAEEHRIECLEIDRALYSLLAEAAGMVADLARAREQYAAALKTSGLNGNEVHNRTRKERLVVDSMKIELPKVLKYFPESIFAGDLPGPDEVRRAMSGKISRKPDALRHFWEQKFYDWARRKHADALGKIPGMTAKKELEFNGHSGDFETCMHRACVMAREPEADPGKSSS